MKTIVLASGPAEAHRALRFIEHRNAGSILVVGADAATCEAGTAFGVRVRSAGEYCSLAEGALWEAVDRIAHSWYRIGGDDLSEFLGIPFAELFFFEFGTWSIYPLLRRMLLVSDVLALEDPDELVIATEDAATIVAIARQYRSAGRLRIDIVRRPWPGRLATHVGGRRWRMLIRSLGFDRSLRAQALRLARLAGLLPGIDDQPVRAPVLVLADIPTESVLGTIAPVAKHLGVDAVVLATDPRCARALQRRGLHPYAFGGSRLARTPDAAAHFEARWRALDRRRAEPAHRLGFLGADLWPALRSTCRSLFRRRFVEALADIDIAENVLARCGTQVVVTAADNHYFGQVFLAAADRRGVRSVCIQHGAFGQPFGYLPVRATALCVWGEAVADWCVQNGAQRTRLRVTGQPRFDAMIREARDPGSERALLAAGLDPSGHTILFAPEQLSGAPALSAWMVQTMLSALGDLPDWQVLLRPHPADAIAQHEALLRHRRDLADRITVSRSTDLRAALAAADSVVLGQSTMGFEAMIMQRPVIVLLPAGAENGVVPYAQENAALRAASSSDLAAAVRTLTPGSPERDALLRRAQGFLVRHYAATDGRATDRVAAVVAELLAGHGPNGRSNTG